LAFKGIWGNSRFEFTPASASILYPIILAAIYMIFGSHLIIALVINIVAGVLTIYVVQRWLIREQLNGWQQLAVLMAMVFLVPLPELMINGMETIWQVLFSFLFVYGFCGWFSKHGPGTSDKRPFPRSLFFYPILLTAFRYEGLFIMLPASVYLLIRRQWLLALGLGFCSLLPAILFGWYSVRHDAYFLPNPILIKSLPMPLVADNTWNIITSSAFERLFFPYPSKSAVACARILILVPFVYWLFIRQLRISRLYRQLLWLILLVTILHLVFTNAVFSFRYECYIVVCLVPVIGTLLAKHIKVEMPEKGGASRLALGCIGIFLILPFVARSWDAHGSTGAGCINMYEQNALIGNFLQKYYYKRPLIMDNLGAVSYMTEGKKLDLTVGVASMAVIKSKEEQYYRPDYLPFIIESYQPDIAIISERKYSYNLLSKWKKVASWSTYNFGLFGDQYMYFYAVDTAAAPALKKNLQLFEPHLPEGVKANYFY
jgi:hypothetical protein